MDFSRKQGASRFFIITTVTLADWSIGNELLELKRELYWQGCEVRDYFHATEDKQGVRDRVFELIGRHHLTIDATLFEKSKVKPRIAGREAYFYKLAWFLHLKHLVPDLVPADRDVFLIAASFGTKAKKASAHIALRDVISQVASSRTHAVAFWRAATDPCLQIADYCAWAIQRKWERNDRRSHVLIKEKIRTEYDIFGAGNTHYY